MEEIKKHDIDTCIKLSLDHSAVTLAFAYLMEESLPEMARRLRSLAQDGHVRVGPFDGFVAAAAFLNDKEYLFLSNKYSEYNSSEEMMASLSGEIGALEEFNRASVENDLRTQKAFEWARNKQKEKEPQSSVISIAVQLNVKNHIKNDNQKVINDNSASTP